MLTQLGITVEQLRTVPGMDDRRIKLLVNNKNHFITLLQHRITLTQIGQLDQQVLQKYFESAYRLAKALPFVTLQQILGLDHTPKAIPAPEAVAPESRLTHIGGSSSGSFGNFCYTRSGNRIAITPRNSIGRTEAAPTLKLLSGEMKAEPKAQLDSELAALAPEQLVHDWYHIKIDSGASDEVKKAMYCPELGYITHESHHPEFPVKELKETGHHALLYSKYYQEKHFTEFLFKNGTSLDELRAIPGMTPLKIETLYNNQRHLSSLLKKGMQFADFAIIEEDRLVHVLSNYDDAEAASSSSSTVDPEEGTACQLL